MFKSNYFENQTEIKTNGIEIEILVPVRSGKGEQEVVYRKEKLCVSGKESLQSVLVENTELFFHGCGRGTCGKCKVKFLKGATMPTAEERRVFSAKELRDGYRLACKSVPKHNCQVEICFHAAKEYTIVTQSVMEQEEQKKKTIEENLQAEAENTTPIMVVDIGTTTLVAQLRSRKGKILEEYADFNPQRICGGDVMSRLQYGVENGEEKLHALICQALLTCAKKFGYDERPLQVYVSGNTTMLHFLFQWPVKELAISPFKPFCLETSKMELGNLNISCLPGISAFVGADIVADYLVVQEQTKKKSWMLIDLGTNAEILLCHNRKYYAAATAAGNAFVGGQNNNVLGSDMIRMAALMKKQGKMDEEGLLAEPFFSEGFFHEGEKISQADIRELQKAKAAVRCGVEILCQQAGISAQEVEEVFLCGGFGLYLHPEDAIEIGMFPNAFLGRVKSVGNIVPKGTCQYALNIDSQEAIRSLKENCNHYNLATVENFENRYMNYMRFA